MNKVLQLLPKKEINQDITKVFQELEDLKFALDQSAIVAITDTSGKILDVNDQFCKISKYSREELVGNTHRIVNSKFHTKQFFNKMWDTIRSGQIWRGDIRNKAKDGSIYWVHSTIIPLLNRYGVPDRYISIRNDITERKIYEEQVAFFAYYDELTCLPNRRKFKVDLEEKMKALKETDLGLSVIFLDLDRFKYINDTKGHSFGDYVLKTIVKRMNDQLDDIGQMYRLGGDEFTIILDSSSYKAVDQLANRLLELFHTPFTIKGEHYFLSLSMGISIFPYHGEDMDSLVKYADAAMYRAKELGGNRIEYYTNDMIDDIKKEMELEHELRKAMENEELYLVYQPKVDLANQKIVGVEALIRWKHDELGIISPAEFIPFAEKTGLIVPISEWTIRMVCKQIIKWNQVGIPPIRVAVNISPILFEEIHLASLIQNILEETEVNPTYLEIEITESVMKDPERALTTLKELKSLGLHISIDDFGTGYSSLSHLKRFPIDTLKIDRSFICEIGYSYEDDAMVKTIIDMANNLNLNVVAEGIETKEQLAFLSKHQCTQGQGYLFSPPIKSNEMKNCF
ncbi:putative bifunctional diguanylate cyclase/phosphodiesterase [Bacillus sp. CGMCC 1.16607]|uniref:putative bifunctional diguanylate cyclase/phosphodiesterase n=1 Tax=Bacillus sp. CGMCC 1.16607 TaxID=3351842 RepID=UPI0036354E26